MKITKSKYTLNKSILQLLSKEPLSTSMIFEAGSIEETDYIYEAVISLLREGKAKFIGFYPSELTGKEEAYYIGRINHKATTPTKATKV